MNYRRLLSSSSLCGDGVRNLHGEDLGKIEDLMINVESGKVEYAVLSFGGIFGIGSKLFAVPWSVLQVSEAERMFIIHVPRERLEQAQGFDKDNWPDFADESFRQGVDAYFAAGR